jgi:galactokinase
VDAFARLYGRAPEVHASAPGRVNLMGEHTDYNGGLVLPMAIPQQTHAALAVREDGRVRAWSREFESAEPEQYALDAECAGRGWLDYVQGVTSALRGAGHAIGGFDLAVASQIPSGAGLSSSAALEVALLRGLRALFALALDDVALARLAQRGENELVGAPVGIMDPLASSLGAPGQALLIDTRTLDVARVALPASLEPVVIASGDRASPRAGRLPHAARRVRARGGGARRRGALRARRGGPRARERAAGSAAAPRTARDHRERARARDRTRARGG